MQKLKRFLKKIWTSFSLKFSLFRIWFMKNILVFLQVLLLICLVSVLTGAVKADTPVLGVLVYPIFAPLVDEISTIIEEKQISDVMSFLTVAISLLVSVSVFTIKMKSIALSDIKSKKLKLAMLKANLYFNANGKLVKKVEKATGQDLDGDGYIDDTGEPIQNENIFSGIKRAMGELVTIVSVKVNDDDEEVNQQRYKETLADANLEQSAEAVKEIDSIIMDGANQILKNKVEEKIYKSDLEDLSDIEQQEEEMDTVIKKSIFRRNSEVVGGWFKKKKRPIDLIEDEIKEIPLEMDVISKTNEEIIPAEVKKQPSDIIPKVSVPKKVVAVSAPKSKDPADAFLNSLRKK